MDIVEALRNDDTSIIINGHICLVKHEAANEIEGLREALREINKRNPFHNAVPLMDKQYYAQIIVEMVGIANAALKEGE